MGSNLVRLYLDQKKLNQEITSNGHDSKDNQIFNIDDAANDEKQTTSNLVKSYYEQKNSTQESANEMAQKLILPNSYLKQYKAKILRKEMEVKLNNEKQQVNDVGLVKKNASFDSSNQITSSNSTLQEETMSNSLHQKFFPYKSRQKPKWLPVYF